jgi:hypothetical protein
MTSMYDRGSTQEWLLPEDRENGRPAEDRESVVADAVPSDLGAQIEQVLHVARASAEVAVEAEQRALLTGNEAEARMEQVLYVARASAEVAVEAEQRARQAGGEAEARIGELTERVEMALAKIEARERATRRRAFEAEREEETMRSFGRRADRIVRRLRQLEQSPTVIRRASPARAG